MCAIWLKYIYGSYIWAGANDIHLLTNTALQIKLNLRKQAKSNWNEQNDRPITMPNQVPNQMYH